jgi:Alginate export
MHRTRWHSRLVVTLLFLTCASVPVLAQSSGSSDSGVDLPKYEDRRFDEDWSVLKGVDLSGRDHFWDRLKFIPLGQEERAWLTLAGQVRERDEYYREFQFGESTPVQSPDYLLSRVRFSVDLHTGKHFRVFGEGKSSLASDQDFPGGEGAGFVDKLDLQNAFADVVVPLGHAGSLTVRSGRQELLFGVQRLVGPSDWTNVRRTFQGVSGIVDLGSWRVTPFWTELVVVDPDRFNKASPDHTLYGVYASGAAHGKVHTDGYWLGAMNTPATFNGTSGRERRQTVGGRLWRGRDRFSAPEPRPSSGAPLDESFRSVHTDFDVEVAGQFGSLGGENIRAWMFSANAGHTFMAQSEPRLFVTVDYASGDHAPGGPVETFNELYPTNHTYLGAVDYVGRQNIISPSGGVDLLLRPSLSLLVTQFFFWRATTADALYGNSGQVLRSGAGTTARYVGAETDAIATYTFRRHVEAYVSYNHFFTGKFIQQTGPDRDSDYLYAAVQFTF